MRALLLGLLFTVACATSGKYVNVAAVRDDINDTIKRDPSSPRTIVSMGHTTEQSAVVYTQASKSAPRREESWVKDAGGWKLKDAKDVGDGAAPAGTAN
jgi:hypothetical protein